MAWRGSYLRVAADEIDAAIIACEFARATGEPAYSILHQRGEGVLLVASSDPFGSGLPVLSSITWRPDSVPPTRPVVAGGSANG